MVRTGERIGYVERARAVTGVFQSCPDPKGGHDLVLARMCAVALAQSGAEILNACAGFG